MEKCTPYSLKKSRYLGNNNPNPKENVTNVKGSISHNYILDASGQFKTFNTIVLTPKPNTAPP